MKSNRLAIAILIVTGLAAASCAGPKEAPMVSNSTIPAAESTVKVDTNENGNTTFELTVKHLALPQRVDPKATVYVVWLRGRDSAVRAQNMGALKVDDNLNGSYSGITPLRDFELFVTAEASVTGTSPTGQALLHTNVSAK
jgi:hypothetical protein